MTRVGYFPQSFAEFALLCVTLRMNSVLLCVKCSTGGCPKNYDRVGYFPQSFAGFKYAEFRRVCTALCDSAYELRVLCVKYSTGGCPKNYDRGKSVQVVSRRL